MKMLVKVIFHHKRAETFHGIGDGDDVQRDTVSDDNDYSGCVNGVDEDIYRDSDNGEI